MTWSDSVVEQFNIVDLNTTEESDFYGPLNSLLSELFSSSEHFQVSPQSLEGSLFFIIQFIVRRRLVPVLFIKVETFRSLKDPSARRSDGDQMTRSFLEFASGIVSAPTLYGISAFGPQFCVYAYNSSTRRLYPPYIDPDPIIVNETAPEARWMYNLLEQAGEGKLREIVNDIKAMVALL